MRVLKSDISSTVRVSLRKYFIPGCVGRGLDLDLRIRPAAAPAASGNPGYTDLAPLGLRSKTRFSNGMAYNRSKVSVINSQIAFAVINFLKSQLPFMPDNFMDG